MAVFPPSDTRSRSRLSFLARKLQEMAVAHDHDRYLPRDDNPAFDPKMFYTLHHVNRPSSALSAGSFRDTIGIVEIIGQNNTSSENWQLFYRAGHYFIRNYDYGPGYQLAIAESQDEQSLPLLFSSRSGKGHQWTLNKVEGGWEMINELIGNGSRYVLLPDGRTAYMQTPYDPKNAVWNITANPR